MFLPKRGGFFIDSIDAESVRTNVLFLLNKKKKFVIMLIYVSGR